MVVGQTVKLLLSERVCKEAEDPHEGEVDVDRVRLLALLDRVVEFGDCLGNPHKSRLLRLVLELYHLRWHFTFDVKSA